MSRLPAIVKVLKETSFYHTSKLADADMALLVKMLKSWPSKMMFPGIYCTLFAPPPPPKKETKHYSNWFGYLLHFHCN
jgi:hypothetical protein